MGHHDSSRPLVRAAAGLFIAVIVGLLLERTRDVTLPFTVAALVAVPLSRAASTLEDRVGLPAALASTIALLGGTALTAGVLVVLAMALEPLTTEAPARLSELQAALGSAVDRLPWSRLGIAQPSPDALVPSQGLGSLAGDAMSSSLGLVRATFLGLLFLLFLVLSRDVLRSKLAGLIDALELSASGPDDLLDQLGGDISRYIWLKTVISVLTGAAFGLACWLAGLPLPLLWGLLACALNYIPSIGPIIASIPGVALCFAEFESVLVAVAVAGILLGIQLLSGAMIEPRVLGDRLDLNIITVLLSLSLWGLIWGPLGMLLAVPLTVALRLVLERSERSRFIADLLAS